MAPLGLWAGAVAAAALIAAALLLERRRDRAAAMALGLLLVPILIAADNWETARFEELRSSPAAAVAVLTALAAIVAVLGALFVRRPEALVYLAVAALPFRVPVEVGGESANLLVPLYLVIAGGVVASCARALAAANAARGSRDGSRPTEGRFAERRLDHPALRWVRVALAAAVVLYALQAGYSDDFSAALEALCFFFVPFAVLFVLLVELRWTPAVLRGALAIVIVAALVFAAIGFWQYGTRELFWNDKVIAGNEVHSWFRVNSLFWDPNILGRYLAVTIVVLATGIAWARRGATAAGALALATILLLALALTFSQSSLAALVVGLIAVAALRWSLRWTLVGAIGLAAVAIALALATGAGTDFGSDTVEAETSGRAGLVSGGLELAGERPLAGFGSGSFEAEFTERFGAGPGVSVVSHTEPITVAAEQGVVGLVVYVALLGSALWTLLFGMRSLAPGLGGDPQPSGAEATAGSWRVSGPWALAAARSALLAAFLTMIVHSFGYAAFLSDPITWALLAAGLALAREPVPRRSEAPGRTPAPSEPAPAGVS